MLFIIILGTLSFPVAASQNAGGSVVEMFAVDQVVELTHAATVQSSVEVGRFHRRFRAPVVIEQDAEYFLRS